MGYERDPVSLLFRTAVIGLLDRAYEQPGEWAALPLPDPSPRARNYFRREFGIDLLGPDNAPTMSGKRQDAKSRWGRGFARAVYFEHRWHYARGRHTPDRRHSPNSRALEIEWGGRIPARADGGFRGGRAVRVRLRAGGQTARRAVDRKTWTDRIYTFDGDAAGRWAEASGRDW